MFKNKKIIPGSMLAFLVLAAVLPMSAFAQRLQFYNEDMSTYTSGANPGWHWSKDGLGKRVGWFAGYKAGGSIGNSVYDFDSVLSNAVIEDKPIFPQGKALTIAPNQSFENIYYRIDTIGDTKKLISLNESVNGSASYYMRWIMYVPEVTENVNFTYNDYHPRMTVALHSTNSSNSSRYEAGVEYIKDADGKIICKSVFFDRGNGQWINGGEIQQGGYYNFLLKLDALQSPSAQSPDNARLKVWKYGLDEPADYSLNYSFTPAASYENIIVFEPKHFGIWNNAYHSFGDFQADGYDGDDITNAEAVFSAAQAWNPQLSSAVKTVTEINDVLASAAQPQNGVTVSYSLNPAADGKAFLNSDGTLSFERPLGGKEDYQFALEATFKKGNAVTRKSYPITITAHPIETDIDVVRNTNGTADLKVSVSNISENAQDIICPAVLAANYDLETGKFCELKYNMPDTDIAAGQTAQVTVSGINVSDKTKTKIFIWDDLNSMQPMTEAETIHIGNLSPDSKGAVDNASGTYITKGEWNTKAAADCYGGDYILSDNGSASIKLPVTQTGYYTVYLRHPSGADLTQKLKIGIIDGEGEKFSVLRDQTINGGYWVLAGTYFLKSDGRQKIILESGDGKPLAFDAVMIELSEAVETKAKKSRF